MIRSRTRTTIWIGLDNDTPESYDIHSEDDMLMIETSQGDNEIELLISADLFPQIKAVIDRLDELGYVPVDRNKK